ncbi:hypothetical protein AX15_007494 [Amanita polypyramis BW_CC]|nr:hypothetical protein AX15_007494 [Amanita polypyramis BW_CC]
MRTDTRIYIKTSAHSSFNIEITALLHAFEALNRMDCDQVTFLVDNENAAKLIWDTSVHNLQYVSIKAMTSFRNWISNKTDTQNVSWCPSHMGIVENEHVNKPASHAEDLEDAVVNSTVLLKLNEIKKKAFKTWNNKAKLPNALGKGFLRQLFGWQIYLHGFYG